MALIVGWRPRALQQVGDAMHWWAANRPEAPQLLREELARMLQLIAEQPRLGPVARGYDVRRVVLPRTGYLLLYRLRPRAQRIEVIAFVHGRRAPR